MQRKNALSLSQGLRLSLVKRNKKSIFKSHFNRIVIFEAINVNQVKLVQIADTHCNNFEQFTKEKERRREILLLQQILILNEP